MLLYVTFSDSGRSCYPVPVDMTTVKGNLRNSDGILAENAPYPSVCLLKLLGLPIPLMHADPVVRGTIKSDPVSLSRPAHQQYVDDLSRIQP